MSDIKTLIAQVREADAKATGGPWTESIVPFQGDDARVVSKNGNVVATVREQYTPGGAFVHNRNAEAIAVFRTAAPVLADEVERLEREYDRAIGFVLVLIRDEITRESTVTSAREWVDTLGITVGNGWKPRQETRR